MHPAVLPHADQRSAEILGLVRQAFVEKGFDGASMQDLARVAGMSVGNFYRYFPSKAAIIQALVQADQAEMLTTFASIPHAKQPMAALRQLIHLHLADNCVGPDSNLWAEIEAAARRNGDIGAAVQQMGAAIATAIIKVFAAETGLTEKEAQRRFSASAGFIMVLFKAASCLNNANPVELGELKSMIIRTIDQTLDDVAHSVRKA